MKKLRQYKGFKIYEATKETENDGYKYACYLKDQSTVFDRPEWQADSEQEIVDFIDTY